MQRSPDGPTMYSPRAGVLRKNKPLGSVKSTHGGFEIASTGLVDGVVTQVTLALSKLSVTLDVQGTEQHIDLSKLFEREMFATVSAGGAKISANHSTRHDQLLYQRLRQPNEAQGAQQSPLEPHHQHNMLQGLQIGDATLQGTCDIHIGGSISRKTTWKTVSFTAALEVTVQLCFWFDNPSAPPAAAAAAAGTNSINTCMMEVIASNESTNSKFECSSRMSGNKEVDSAAADKMTPLRLTAGSSSNMLPVIPTPAGTADALTPSPTAAAADAGNTPDTDYKSPMEESPIKSQPTTPTSSRLALGGTPNCKVLDSPPKYKLPLLRLKAVHSNSEGLPTTPTAADGTPHAFTPKTAAAGSADVQCKSTFGDSTPKSQPTTPMSSRNLLAAISEHKALTDVVPQPRPAAAAAAAESAANHTVLLVGLKPAVCRLQRPASFSTAAAGAGDRVLTPRSPAAAAAAAATEDWAALAAAASSPRKVRRTPTPSALDSVRRSVDKLAQSYEAMSRLCDRSDQSRPGTPTEVGPAAADADTQSLRAKSPGVFPSPSKLVPASIAAGSSSSDYRDANQQQDVEQKGAAAAAAAAGVILRPKLRRRSEGSRSGGSGCATNDVTAAGQGNPSNMMADNIVIEGPETAVCPAVTPTAATATTVEPSAAAAAPPTSSVLDLANTAHPPPAVADDLTDESVLAAANESAATLSTAINSSNSSAGSEQGLKLLGKGGSTAVITLGVCTAAAAAAVVGLLRLHARASRAASGV